MASPPKALHPAGEAVLAEKRPLSRAIEVETFAGKVHVEWDPTAAVMPIGQLPFFYRVSKTWLSLQPLGRAMPAALCQ